MITTRQAMALASDVPEHFVEELDQIERDYPDDELRHLLRRWVRLWAPVVAAAEAQADAAAACDDESASGQAWVRAIYATEAAVRAAREVA